MAKKDSTPTKPSGLRPEAEKRWKEIWGSPAARAWDRDSAYGAMVRYIALYDAYLGYAEDVRKNPNVQVSQGRGKPKRTIPNPSTTRMASLARELSAFEAEWGLTLKSADKLGIPANLPDPDEPPAPLDATIAVIEGEVKSRLAQESTGADRKILARVRALRALTMRLDGATYHEIGLVLGISAEGAKKAALRALNALGTEPVKEQIALAVQRYERLTRAMMPLALAGDVKAAKEVRETQNAIVALLGLAKPQKIEVSLADVEADTRAKARQMGLSDEEADKAVEFVKEHLGLVSTGG